jgi:hypothetical protein
VTPRRKTALLIGGGIALVAAIAAVVVLTSRSSDNTPTIDPVITKQQNYHQAQYAAGVSSGWPQDSSDQRVGKYLESSWHDPVSTTIQYIIDSASAEEGASPMALAELARAQARELKDYRERGLQWSRLRGIPVVRWAYDAAGLSRIEFFFEECGIDIVARGSMAKPSFESFADFYRGMASTITAKCD